MGCGIAGASLAYELSQTGASVIVLEAEPYAAYHTTGRSAAFYMEAYGNETVREITQASRHFFDQPPAGFSDVPLLTPCGALYLARKDQHAQLERLYQQVSQRIDGCKLVDQSFLHSKLPPLKIDNIESGFWEPHSMEIDVAALLEGYIRLAKKNNTQFHFNQTVQSLHFANEQWFINEKYQAITLINAAGAWADDLAELAGANKQHLKPKKRTICIAKIAAKMDISLWPLTLDIDEQFYFKPEGQNLLITPADESPSFPHDVQAEEYDVALGIDRVQKVLDIEFTQVIRQWAGLRTFSADKSPVVGYDTRAVNFFWLAGQGGYGIQMAPALAKLAAQLALKHTPSVSPSLLNSLKPNRFP